MQNRKSPVRHHSRFPVSWPVLYGNDTFLAEGTVLDLTALGWRVAGSMPVAPGMQLTLQVSVPERPTPLRVQRATVLWVKDHEFAIEAHEMESSDQAWVTEFLRHKLGLMWMSRTTDQKTSLQAGNETPRRTADLTPPCVPSIEDVLQRFLALHTDLNDGPTEARWNDDLDSQEDAADASCDRVPEKIWHEAHCILRGILVINEARARTGRNLIQEN
ncbi:MAG: hypothetical protein KF722_06915 [Nitrospira sp.]|nr:hypothetical protein [Nitrospira sp.]